MINATAIEAPAPISAAIIDASISHSSRGNAITLSLPKRLRKRAKVNIFATNIVVIHINELACAKLMCEIPADFRSRRKA